ncbi:dTDP-glucose 4,6-dehydratase [Schleiferilactobacillus shenzhenensis]|uniref:dTDP-glucose 4,6-dehydratase n=1 Tax=Schleiferilactobacillus shenzhenensis LY-73 TaxID=1231336 RepID=U4TLV3_9LACO|nr:dTDP-glucose 4,6-dehydratase [Schleiferilactobacillus shenzhenensis]ERL65199.1 RfbB [Schleiferilactobacillus shenzhenensis LY-73]
MHLLITGGAGFIGSNFIHYMRQAHPEDTLINLDALTYAGNLANLADIPEDAHYHFVRGSILNHDLLVHLIREYRIDAIVNFAAESHVDRSISDPMVFIDSNIKGVATLLDVARTTGVRRFQQVSTDEVYGSMPAPQQATEETPLNPSSPYSAAKASADLLVLAAHRTYGQDVTITRCSNNYGPYQYPEKLIPLMIQHGLEGKTLPVYGTGENIRDWLYVSDHCWAIDLVLRKAAPGSIYNISGHNERTNLAIIHEIITQLHIDPQLIRHVADRPGHDWRYSLDASKLHHDLGWQPTVSFAEGMHRTIQWYQDHQDWWRDLNQQPVR